MATKEVYFGEYCHLCKFYDYPEKDDPCDLCLGNPSNEDSHKPLYFEEAEGVKNK